MDGYLDEFIMMVNNANRYQRRGIDVIISEYSKTGTIIHIAMENLAIVMDKIRQIMKVD